MQNVKLTYDSISPITGNFCVLEEVDTATGITSFLCMESGWSTADTMIIGSDAVQQFESQCSEIMRNSRVDDTERGLSWFPIFIQLPTCMLYCVGSSANDVKWELSRIVPVDDSEKTNYPIIGSDNEYYTSKLDVDNAIQYDKLDFDSALNALYSILEQDINEYQDQLRDNGVQ
jgi:hypothetical protein